MKVALKEANDSVSCNKNFVCSPISIEILLCIVAVGSSGETRNQLLKFLGSKTLKAINKKASELMDIVYPETGGIQSEGPVVSFVNGAWVDQRFSLQPSFQTLVENTYRAEAKAVDFGQKEEVCREVNLWASKATQGLIDGVLSPQMLQRDTMLILGNSLFFKAAWQYPFTCCMNKKFHLLTGETIEVPLMTRGSWGTFTGAMFDGFKLVRLPYKGSQDQADTPKFAIYIILPDAKNGLVNLMQKFSKDSSFLDQNFELQRVYIQEFWIPKFKFSHTLKQHGLDRMFEAVGELNKIVSKASSEALCVSEFCQKSVIEVNEEGTVAAAVTLCMYGGGGPSPDVFSFVADHPFMFMIREETSGVTFFVGTVLNPVLGL